MLFIDILNEQLNNLQPEFDCWFDDILKKQTHSGDLLLVRENGFYSEEALKWNNVGVKNSPYLIGPNTEGHAEDLHYRIIDEYRKKAIFPLEHKNYLRLVAYTPERQKEIEALVKDETVTVQSELDIYLKIWEGDMFVKRLYQLVRLAAAESYDWHFKIAESERDPTKTGKKDVIIRKMIRDKLAIVYPRIFDSIKSGYKTQIRNSIAHSKYSIHGRYIHLNNKIERDKHAQIEVVSFDEWAIIFHNTLSIYNLLIRFSNMIDSGRSGINSLIFVVDLFCEQGESPALYSPLGCIVLNIRILILLFSPGHERN
jgi:hypothetical protein